MISTIFYLLKESFRGIRRTWFQSLASILMIMLSIVIFTAGIFTYLNVNLYSEQIKSSYQLDVFFSAEIDSIGCRDLYNKIYSFPFITEGEFISSKKASAIFSHHFEQDIQELFGGNPLPCSGKYTLIKSLQNLEGLNKIKKQLLVIDGVNDIHFQHSLIGNLDRISGNIAIGFSLIGTLFLIITFFILANTMKLVIFTRSEVFSILKLHGASSFFVWLPIIGEGVIQGILGGLLAAAGGLLLKSLLNYLFIPFIEIYTASDLTIILLSLSAGLILGFIGCILGISQYNLSRK